MTPTSSTGEPRRRRREDARTAQRRGDGGVSLIEVLAALTLAAVLTAALAGVVARRPPALAEASQGVVAALRAARAEAVRGGAPARVSFAPALRSYGAGDAPRVLPDGVSLSLLAAAETRRPEAKDGSPARDDAKALAIVFFPDGSSTGGVVSLTAEDGRAARIEVRWLTGQIRRSQIRADASEASS